VSIDVYFLRGTFELDVKNQEAVIGLIEHLKSEQFCADMNAYVIGRSVSGEVKDERVVSLSQSRAESVKSVLLNTGMFTSRTVSAFGEGKYIRGNGDSEINLIPRAQITIHCRYRI
jgi:outer membrane protein OmpA-like peptidoglycan-associated protein